MPYRSDDTIETKLRVTALDILIKAEWQKHGSEFLYDDAIHDLHELVALSKDVFSKDVVIEKRLQERLFESTRIAFDHLEADEKINLKSFYGLCFLSSEINKITKTHRHHISGLPPKTAQKIFL